MLLSNDRISMLSNCSQIAFMSHHPLPERRITMAIIRSFDRIRSFGRIHATSATDCWLKSQRDRETGRDMEREEEKGRSRITLLYGESGSTGAVVVVIHLSIYPHGLLCIFIDLHV